MKRWAANLGEAMVLVCCFAALMGGAGYLLLSWPGLWSGLAVAGFVVLTSSRLMPPMVLRMFAGRPLRISEAPTLYALTQMLCERARIRRVPQLYYLPSQALSIFTVGRPGRATIALSDGLMRSLNTRELAGMLAHEIAHIRRRDLWVFNLADAISRTAALLAVLGVLLAVIGLPMTWATRLSLSWWAVALLILSPTLLGLCQLVLPHAREAEADVEAVDLTRDPIGLMHGLRKFDLVEFRPLQRIMLGGHRTKEPSLLRSHLSLTHRLRRLRAMNATHAPIESTSLYTQLGLPNLRTLVTRPPRWHWTGLWY